VREGLLCSPTLPLPAAAQKPDGSKATPSCQAIVSKQCGPIKNCYSLPLLCEPLRCTGISVSSAWLAPKLRPGTAVSFALRAGELSCSGSSKAGQWAQWGLRVTPRTLAMASPKGQGGAPWWKPDLPHSASESCNPPPRQQGWCYSAGVVPSGLRASDDHPVPSPLPAGKASLAHGPGNHQGKGPRAVVRNSAWSHMDELGSHLCFILKSTWTILSLSLSMPANQVEFHVVLSFMPAAVALAILLIILWCWFLQRKWSCEDPLDNKY